MMDFTRSFQAPALIRSGGPQKSATAASLKPAYWRPGFPGNSLTIGGFCLFCRPENTKRLENTKALHHLRVAIFKKKITAF